MKPAREGETGLKGIDGGRKWRSNIRIEDPNVLKALRLRLRRVDPSGTATDGREHTSNAKTILSSWIIGMDEERCAARILYWWCVDSHVEGVNIDNANEVTAKRVRTLAREGYGLLHDIEKGFASGGSPFGSRKGAQ